jgi:predicted nuclease of predicted toxin-antitoxin system
LRLLLDENLSPRLVAALADLFPGSRHVRDVGLARADDEEVWTFAGREGFMIVSKDSDFHQRSFVRGAPPKVIWVRRGNASTAEIERIVRAARDRIAAFAGDPEAAFLILDG